MYDADNLNTFALPEEDEEEDDGADDDDDEDEEDDYNIDDDEVGSRASERTRPMRAEPLTGAHYILHSSRS